MLRGVNKWTSYTSIEKTLFKQFAIGDEVLCLSSSFLWTSYCVCAPLGFCDQASSWSSLCGWNEKFYNQ